MKPRGGDALSPFFLPCSWRVCPALAPSPSRPADDRPDPRQGDRASRVTAASRRRCILGRVGTQGRHAVRRQPRLAEDIRAIFALGFFDDVQVRVEDFEGGVKLTFVVAERPVRPRRALRRATRSRTRPPCSEKIDLKLGTVYNPVEVNRAADKLKDYYEEEGYFEVGGQPRTSRSSPDGDVTVTFRIAEGRKITIDQIVIEGAQGLTPKQVRRRSMDDPGARVLHPARHRPAAEARRGRRPHRPALQRPRLRAGARRVVGHPGGPGQGAGHHPHRGGGGPAVQGRRRRRHRQRAPARGGDPAAASSSSRATSSRGPSSGTASPGSRTSTARSGGRPPT